MAELVNMAGEGLPLYLWSKMAAAGETAWDVGRQRAQREAGSFSFGNTIVREEGGKVVAALVSYALPEQAEEIDYDNMPAMFVPLQELENRVPGSWYVNVLATYGENRGSGFGSGLLQLAEQLAVDAACPAVSLIVADGNQGARRLYARRGYVELESRPIVKESWQTDSENWVLMKKPV